MTLGIGLLVMVACAFGFGIAIGYDAGKHRGFREGINGLRGWILDKGNEETRRLLRAAESEWDQLKEAIDASHQ